MKGGRYINSTKSPICGGRTGRGLPQGFPRLLPGPVPLSVVEPGAWWLELMAFFLPTLNFLDTVPGWGCPHGRAFADSERSGNLCAANLSHTGSPPPPPYFTAAIPWLVEDSGDPAHTVGVSHGSSLTSPRSRNPEFWTCFPTGPLA